MAKARLTSTWGIKRSKKNLLKDIQQLTLSCQTGSLEVYHSVQTKYLHKRQHFWYKGMVAWTQLAALDHNANTSRDNATASRGDNKGELHFKEVFPKRSKEWIAKPIMEKTTRDHVHPLLDAIVERKSQDAAERSASLTAPHIPHNTACTRRQKKQTLLQGTHLDFLILEWIWCNGYWRALGNVFTLSFVFFWYMYTKTILTF